MDDKIKNVAILGTGLIGASWAAFYAGKGFKVKLYDANKSQCDSGFEKAVEYLNFLEKHGAISTAICKKAAGSIQCVSCLKELVSDTGLVQESVAERYDVKKIAIDHHNLKTPFETKSFIERHAFFIQDVKLHLIGGRRKLFQILYEILIPRYIQQKFLSTMFVVIARKNS